MKWVAAILGGVSSLIVAAFPVYLHFETVAVDRAAARERAMERRISNEFQIKTLESDLLECLDALSNSR